MCAQPWPPGSLQITDVNCGEHTLGLWRQPKPRGNKAGAPRFVVVYSKKPRWVRAAAGRPPCPASSTARRMRVWPGRFLALLPNLRACWWRCVPRPAARAPPAAPAAYGCSVNQMLESDSDDLDYLDMSVRAGRGVSCWAGFLAAFCCMLFTPAVLCACRVLQNYMPRSERATMIYACAQCAGSHACPHALA